MKMRCSFHNACATHHACSRCTPSVHSRGWSLSKSALTLWSRGPSEKAIKSTATVICTQTARPALSEAWASFARMLSALLLFLVAFLFLPFLGFLFAAFIIVLRSCFRQRRIIVVAVGNSSTIFNHNPLQGYRPIFWWSFGFDGGQIGRAHV